jgi:mannitol/fructose-specific phosphotransferase system IIA component (Ntr-type)
MLTEILQPTCVKVPLEGKDKNSIITELVDLLEQRKMLNNKESVLNTILNREQMLSSGIGSGVAIPHGKCRDLNKFVMAMGLAREPVEFDSIDGKPVQIIIMLVSPSDKTGLHIQALGRIGRMLHDDKFKAKIEAAETAEQLYEFVSEKETERPAAVDIGLAMSA